MFYAKG
jgi:hypothetical protein